MSFWRDAFGWGWVTADQLRLMVITDTFAFGEITKQEYEDITGQPYDLTPTEPDTPEEPEPETEEPAPKKK
ncbi:XkdX family protein [Sporosarcina sp. FSL W7-1283]|uniref:XkdX family protein n=1 Tax=Sporosarcina sp. FSL W7-1283 TaxID=2921560 RepID=UPI0030FA50D1